MICTASGLSTGCSANQRNRAALLNGRSPATGRETAQLVDAIGVIELVDGPHVKTHHIHIGLEKSSQFLDIVIVDDEESSTTACQVVPTLNAFGVIRARIMLFDQSF